MLVKPIYIQLKSMCAFKFFGLLFKDNEDLSQEEDHKEL